MNMIAHLVSAAVLAFIHAECILADNHIEAYPVFAQEGSAKVGSVPLPQAKQLLVHFQQRPRPQPRPYPPPPPPPQPQPQPQPVPNPKPDPSDPYELHEVQENADSFDPYGARQQFPDPELFQPQTRVQPQPQPNQPAPEPHRGFSIEDIESKPIFVFTTTDDKSYDIVYALSGISGLNLDPATKYIADFLISNDTEKLVVVFNYQNFPFTKLPDLPIARLILPNDLKLSFFDLENLNKPIVAIFTKQQLNALDSFVQNTHVSLIGQIKLPKPASSSRTGSIHGVNYVLGGFKL
ncbi:unnamed protein product [Bemisia tabaci]|uniref:Uncharacterized protein n=1 Tax=Bemisia tabaci TaxID=7038 RepID=A0A9P0F5M0_BEMTA|nr:unnamed protein product [Bemisia tabaci]